MVGPRGMTEAQVAYWEAALRRMSESEEWKKELEANFWSSEFMGGADMRKSLERDNVVLRAFLVDLGLAK
jgi:putative tricarboxylic transport membrane protein